MRIFVREPLTPSPSKTYFPKTSIPGSYPSVLFPSLSKPNSPATTPVTSPFLPKTRSLHAMPGNISTPKVSAFSANHRHTLPIDTM